MGLERAVDVPIDGAARRPPAARHMAARLRRDGIQDPRVLDALASVARHAFVEDALRRLAYQDTALPIGHGQTLSQPWIVARMTELLLAAHRPRSVLEIGTGSGYQAAVLAQLVPHVYTVERLQGLHETARERLARLGIPNVALRHGDGRWGWTAVGPFDAIVVTAGARRLPEGLLRQLTPAGRLIIPLGTEGRQELHQITRRGRRIANPDPEAVQFVPLLEGYL